MPTTVRDDTEHRNAATSIHNFEDAPNGRILVRNIQVIHPLTIGYSYRLIDGAHPNGVSAALEHQPGPGMQIATFVRNP